MAEKNKIGNKLIDLTDPNAQNLLPYSRSAVKIGIAHIGVGNFHRAHQALYADQILESGDLQWGISGIALLESDRLLVDALKSQNGLYTLVERDNENQNARIVGSIIELIAACDSCDQALERLSDPETRIVSLTITEHGYCHNPTTKQIDLTRPEVIHDLKNPAYPQSACGYVVEALNRRRLAGHAPFTVLSCDNIPSNGETARNVILALARARSRELDEWVEQNCTFPNTMVDRITPASRPETRAWVESEFGIVDKAPVVCEPFRQWVIEDKFCNGRPDWDKLGAIFVDDVHLYELAKIRLLNVAHSALAYPGLLIGLEFVHEAATHPVIRPFIENLMSDEIAPTLHKIEGFDYGAYSHTILERFTNTAIADRLERICSDGSQKLSNQLYSIIKERMEQGESFQRLSFTLAAWLRYLVGRDEASKEYKVVDPIADKLTHAVARYGEDFGQYIEDRDFFPVSLTSNPDFAHETSFWLTMLYHRGVEAAIKQLEEGFGV